MQCFLKGIEPELTFEDGVEVAKILMACYILAVREKRESLWLFKHMSAEAGTTINFVDVQDKLKAFVPSVALVWSTNMKYILLAFVLSNVF